MDHRIKLTRNVQVFRHVLLYKSKTIISEVLLDVLNAFNDTAEEALVTDTLQTELRSIPTFGQPNAFIDPRRAMVSVRLSLGR